MTVAELVAALLKEDQTARVYADKGEYGWETPVIHRDDGIVII